MSIINTCRTCLRHRLFEFSRLRLPPVRQKTYIKKVVPEDSPAPLQKDLLIYVNKKGVHIALLAGYLIGRCLLYYCSYW